MSTSPFYAIEGVDGVGKSTLATSLAEKIKGVCRHTPYGPVGNIRKLFDQCGNSQARYLYYLSTLVIAAEDVRKDRERSPVIFDRYLPSTVCYHAESGVPICQEQIDLLNLVRPDLTICLTATRDVRLARITRRNTLTLDVGIESKLDYLDAVQVRIVEMADYAIDTTQLESHQVLEEVMRLIARHSVDKI
jgi:dTMP kinase